jgi:Family of unknown function (DUF6498)
MPHVTNPLGTATLVQPPDRLTRAFNLYRRTTASRSALALVLANAIPLVGVLFFGWSLWTILVLYWVENGIVGFWTVPRILLASGTITGDMTSAARAGLQRWSAMAAQRPGVNAAQQARVEAAIEGALDAEVGSAPAVAQLAGVGALLRIPMALFFLFHYGMFWLVHGVFVFVLPTFGAFQSGDGPGGSIGDTDPMTGQPFFPGAGGATAVHGAWGEIAWSSVAIGAVALLIAHGASFVLNYLGRGEYLHTSAAREMGKPYGRVVVLHLTLIFGAFAIAILGAPIGALVVFVIAKTVLDLGLHLREHASPR